MRQRSDDLIEFDGSRAFSYTTSLGEDPSVMGPVRSLDAHADTIVTIHS